MSDDQKGGDMTTRDEFADCPFCGSEAVADTTLVKSIEAHTVLCNSCGVAVPLEPSAALARSHWDTRASRQEVSVTVPRVTDNDRDEITVMLDGKELRGWSYSSDLERRTKMLCAREYVEGFCTGRQS